LILQKCKKIKVENGMPAGRPRGGRGEKSPYDTGILENPAGKLKLL